MKRSPLKPSKKPMKRSRMKRSARSNLRRDLDTEWARRVKERDQHRCQFPQCGVYSQQNHAHHIATRKRRPDLRWATANGITLCLKHHDWVHAHPVKAAELGLLSTEKYEFAARGK